MARIKCMNNKEKTKQDELTLIIEELISKPLDDLFLFESFVSIRLPPSCSLCSALFGSRYVVFLI